MGIDVSTCDLYDFDANESSLTRRTIFNIAIRFNGKKSHLLLVVGVISFDVCVYVFADFFF